MTFGGWLFLSLSLSFVWGLTGWCFYRVAVAPETPEPNGSPGRHDRW